MTKPDEGLTYAAAGVHIDAGNALVERIKPAAAATTRSGTVSGLGGFGALFDLRAAGYADPILVAATDGVGTKLRIGIETGRLRGLGTDLVAMCVNDLICQGAEPLFFLDYYATGHLDIHTATELVEGIAEACRASGCALIGGETAEMPGLYAAGDFDVAGFSVGALERGTALPADVQPGDALLGLASSGPHSNGYSLIRRVIAETGLAWDTAAPFSETSLAEALLTPTRLYVRPLLAAIRAGGVHGLAHITGGGLPENLPRILPEGCGAVVDRTAWPLPAVFSWLKDKGRIAESEMLRTFNCGIGMVAVVAAGRAEALSQLLRANGEDVRPLGRVTDSPGITFV